MLFTGHPDFISAAILFYYYYKIFCRSSMVASAALQLFIWLNNPSRIRSSPPIEIYVRRTQLNEKSGNMRDIPTLGRSAHSQLSSL